MQCTHVSQFLRLGCVPYVTALEACWCTEASAALLLSLFHYWLQVYDGTGEFSVVHLGASNLHEKEYSFVKPRQY